MVLIWQIMDNSPNSLNFPPPNFPTIQYIGYIPQYSITIILFEALIPLIYKLRIKAIYGGFRCITVFSISAMVAYESMILNLYAGNHTKVTAKAPLV